MIYHLLFTWGPFALAALLASAITLLSPRPLAQLDPRRSSLAALAGLLPVFAIAALRVGAIRSHAPALHDLGVKAIIPLALGTLAVCLLMVPERSSCRPQATAQLAPRTVMSFLHARWLVALAVLVVAIGGLSVAAGLASSRDDLGRFTEYTIYLGTTGGSATSGIYGWHYSMPALAAVIVLTAMTAIAWLLIPRPAWTDDPTSDAAVRTLRAANIGRMTCGALLIHLSTVLSSLGGTASMLSTADTTELGTVSVHTPFAALGPALWWSSWLTLALGLTLWIFTALTGLPARSRRASLARTA